MTPPSIPKVVRFVWFGAEFPWPNTLAMRSALANGGLDRVVIHHADDLSGSPHFRAIAGTPGIECERLNPAELAERLDDRGLKLFRLFSKLETPEARSDWVRLVLLYLEGGVYLDLDTVTIRSLRPLTDRSEAFCGTERVAIPGRAARSKSPAVRGASFVRGAIRNLFRVAPGGWSGFRAIERFYPLAPNNAVLGSAPRGRFVDTLLDRALALPLERATARYALGPHLLQDACPEFREPALCSYPPEYFYPLGPEISEHWFRVSERRPPVDRVLSSETRVVHWYASVRTKDIVPKIDPAYVLAHRDRQLWSALVAPFVES